MKKKPVISMSVIIAFLTPYISVASGLLVSWLFVHFHWLGVFHLDSSQVARSIAGVVVFGITSVLTYAAAHFHWLPVVFTTLAVREAENISSVPDAKTGVIPSASGGKL